MSWLYGLHSHIFIEQVEMEQPLFTMLVKKGMELFVTEERFPAGIIVRVITIFL